MTFYKKILATTLLLALFLTVPTTPVNATGIGDSLKEAGDYAAGIVMSKNPMILALMGLQTGIREYLYDILLGREAGEEEEIFSERAIKYTPGIDDRGNPSEVAHLIIYTHTEIGQAFPHVEVEVERTVKAEELPEDTVMETVTTDFAGRADIKLGEVLKISGLKAPVDKEAYDEGKIHFFEDDEIHLRHADTQQLGVAVGGLFTQTNLPSHNEDLVTLWGILTRVAFAFVVLGFLLRVILNMTPGRSVDWGSLSFRTLLGIVAIRFSLGICDATIYFIDVLNRTILLETRALPLLEERIFPDISSYFRFSSIMESFFYGGVVNIMMIVVAILFIARSALLVFLTIVSPLAFLGASLDFAEGLLRKWANFFFTAVSLQLLWTLVLVSFIYAIPDYSNPLYKVLGALGFVGLSLVVPALASGIVPAVAQKIEGQLGKVTKTTVGFTKKGLTATESSSYANKAVGEGGLVSATGPPSPGGLAVAALTMGAKKTYEGVKRTVKRTTVETERAVGEEAGADKRRYKKRTGVDERSGKEVRKQEKRHAVDISEQKKKKRSRKKEENRG